MIDARRLVGTTFHTSIVDPGRALFKNKAVDIIHLRPHIAFSNGIQLDGVKITTVMTALRLKCATEVR